MNIHTASLLCAVVGASVYLTTLQHDLVYDDIPAIKYNRDLTPNRPWSALLVHDFWGSALDHPKSHKSYRPLCVATFRLNYLLHKLEPMGYHLVNILLHGAVCYLYVQLCSLVFSEVWPALIAGLLFAVHPIHTEAVAGVVGRAELLCALFYLSTILIYKRSLQRQDVSISWFTASLLSSVLALLSKEQGVTVLGVCLVLDYFILHDIDLSSLLRPSYPSPPASPTIKHFPKLKEQERLRPFFIRGIAVGVVGLVSIATRIMVPGGVPQGMFQDKTVNPALFQEWPWRPLSWLHLVFVNCWLALDPSALTADWRFGAVPLTHSLSDHHNILTLLTLVSLTILATFALSGRGSGAKVTLLGLSLMVFPYLPASNLFFPVGFVVAERVLYLPSMGLCLLVAHGAWKLLVHTRRNQITNGAIKGMVLLLLLIYSIKTVHRNKDWSSNISLYSAGVKVNPHNAVMMNNLGLQYVMRGDGTSAVRYYKAAMILTPNYTHSYYNYGKLLTMAQHFEQAEQPLRTAISLGETSGGFNKMAESYHLLIESLLTQPSRLHEAHTLIDHALSNHPHHADLHTDKCYILDRLNRTVDAVKWCQESLSLKPSEPRTHYQLGVAYMRLGSTAEAERAFRDMLTLEQDSTLGMLHLATLLQRQGREEHLTEAMQLWQQVVNIEPRNVDALLGLAQTQDLLSHTQSAVTTVNKVLKLQPFNRQALYHGAQLLYRQGNLAEASRVLNRLYRVDSGYRDVGVMLTQVETELSSR